MSQDQTVTIEVDGRELQVPAGAMLIDVAEEAGIHIPRFCYHKKLSTSANCRMCLVEVEKVPKPLPACATSVNEGMKAFTRSPLALEAQKGTMEFLLINHPLDCPICDQGGECELQDVAVGYGSDVSRFVEGKRVALKKDIGPLIATNFTRCIHCTRCVRFSAEIAGIREMGATGRSEFMKIGTYIEKSIDSELSGNLIDVCPVGSLTSKPYRYQARPWELVQRDSIAPHDSVGSNIHIHSRRNEVMRIHPKENESVNECWISDRDRFSYQGLRSDDRLTRPMIKRQGGWVAVSWSEALGAAAKGLKQTGADVGGLFSPSSTLEELFLAQKLIKALGSNYVDTRLRQSDFRGEIAGAPWLGQGISDLESLDAALVIGSNIRKDQPLLAHRLRKAANEGAKIALINPMRLALNFEASQQVSSPAAMLNVLASVAQALGVSGSLVEGGKTEESHKAIATELKAADASSVLLGNIAVAHPDFARIYQLASAIADASGAILGLLPEAANTVGAALVGANGTGDHNVQAMLDSPLKGYLLMGVEPGFDFWNPAQAAGAFDQADYVVAISGYSSPSLETAADVMLPMAGFAETSGTYVNAEGIWQSFSGAVTPMGESRPGWKILRVLGNLLDLSGFDQNDSNEILIEARQAAEETNLDNKPAGSGSFESQLSDEGLVRIGDVPLYARDPLVRRAPALQQTSDAIASGLYMNAAEAKRAGLVEGDTAQVKQDTCQASLTVQIDSDIPDGCVRIPAGLAGTETLGGQFGPVILEKA